jgi:hypothetical protein
MSFTSGAELSHAAQVFQALEMEAAVFPSLGKFHGNFSEPWKISSGFFQGP